jgi:hypothetical protein
MEIKNSIKMKVGWRRRKDSLTCIHFYTKNTIFHFFVIVVKEAMCAGILGRGSQNAPKLNAAKIHKFYIRTLQQTISEMISIES